MGQTNFRSKAFSLQNLMDTELFIKSLNPGQKLVVFSESTDTINYLKENISRNDVLTISAANRSKNLK